MASQRQIRNLRQLLTRWPTSASSYDGYTFGTPVVLRCRWEDTAVQFRDGKGEEVTSQAIAYVEDDVAIGDYVALGNLDNISDPTTLVGAYRVRQFSKITNLRNTEVERKAYL